MRRPQVLPVGVPRPLFESRISGRLTPCCSGGLGVSPAVANCGVRNGRTGPTCHGVQRDCGVRNARAGPTSGGVSTELRRSNDQGLSAGTAVFMRAAAFRRSCGYDFSTVSVQCDRLGAKAEGSPKKNGPARHRVDKPRKRTQSRMTGLHSRCGQSRIGSTLRSVQPCARSSNDLQRAVQTSLAAHSVTCLLAPIKSAPVVRAAGGCS